MIALACDHGALDLKKAIMKRKGYRHINKNISKMWRKEQ